MNADSGMRRMMALWFPFLPTDRVRIEEPERCIRSSDTQPEPPFALVGKERGAMVLRALEPHARQLGLMAGMTLADARARVSELVVADMNVAADAHWLIMMAQHCLRWSPMVMPVPPDAILIDSSGCAHLFGGEADLAALIEEEMVAKGMTLRLACASTAEAALALARYAELPIRQERDAIRALPVAALGLDADAQCALRRAGLTTIDDVATRPSSSIAARFGMEAVTALRRLIGEDQAPMDVLAAPASLRFQRRFAEPIGHQDSVMAVLGDLLRDAARIMEERALGGRHFGLILFRSDNRQYRLAIETGQPCRDPVLVLRLFEERIAALADPLDPGFGYDSLELHILRAEPLAASQPALDGSERTEAQLAGFIDRIAARYGSGTLRRLIPQDRHIPEQAQRTVPAAGFSAPLHWATPPVGEPPMRPLLLFDPPQPVEVIAEVPDGPPLRFRWRRVLHEVRLYEGPERISSEWWRRKNGEHGHAGGLTRDYFRIEDVSGRRYWIFRHGLYDEKPDPLWYLHGQFA